MTPDMFQKAVEAVVEETKGISYDDLFEYPYGKQDREEILGKARRAVQRISDLTGL